MPAAYLVSGGKSLGVLDIVHAPTIPAILWTKQRCRSGYARRTRSAGVVLFLCEWALATCKGRDDRGRESGRRPDDDDKRRRIYRPAQAKTKYLRTVSTTSQVPFMPGSITNTSPAFRCTGSSPSGVMMQ